MENDRVWSFKGGIKLKYAHDTLSICPTVQLSSMLNILSDSSKPSFLPELTSRFSGRTGESISEGFRVGRCAQNTSEGWGVRIGIDILHSLLFAYLAAPP
jgi:hypothetical protein